jgi:hypothetical protein
MAGAGRSALPRGAAAPAGRREEGHTAGDLVHRGHLHSCREIAKDPAMATRRDDRCNSGRRTCRR